ncbi:EDD domain protein, DegV family [Caloramator quimbayensis]|uniref:EDD domain protein, DegV family n=1 Tax=Caloramator quimbayensis TaxID=1147123 RepID=A0A1T4XWN7_9CLOT|nr:DegV family protein [Caloramator quimbayensis]SKA93475.1 EDD domain protein, DegV family [Caloramator quimbayensis]
MKRIFVVTDSTADLPKDYIEKKNIIVAPLTVIYNGISYRDRIDIDNNKLFSFLKEGKELPKTSQVNPQSFYEIYSNLLKEDCYIISIHISSGLSGTYQSALIAKQMIGSDNVYVVDSRSVSFGTGLLVMEAQSMIEKGIEITEIYERLIELSSRVRVAFILDTLEYIKKGGRISSAKATIGTLLNIKPIIHSKDGKLLIWEKARGVKKGIELLLKYISENNLDKDYNLAVGSIGFEKEASDFLNRVKELTQKDIVIPDVGTVIATYSGPNVIGVYFFEK